MMFRRPEHRIIADLLSRLDATLLLQARCFFAGGTAIVLQNGEYRRSLDIDFLCADQIGYRDLRSRATETGIAGLFRSSIDVVREVRADQYGIRTFLRLNDFVIKFEIVREARIALDGGLDPLLAVPVLSVIDQMTEKLLANADRGLDNATAHRDAIDLGMLISAHGVEPLRAAMAKAEAAYGADIRRKLLSVIGLLQEADRAQQSAAKLEMLPADLVIARSALVAAADAI